MPKYDVYYSSQKFAGSVEAEGVTDARRVADDSFGPDRPGAGIRADDVTDLGLHLRQHPER